MKRCRVCETEVGNEISVCPVCGSTFTEDDIITESDGRKMNIKPIIIILSVIILALIIVLICFLPFSYSGREITDNKESNSHLEMSSFVSASDTEASPIQNTTIEIIINETYYVKYSKKSVSMYEKANPDSNIVMEIKPDGKSPVKVKALKEENGFFYVKYKDHKGFIDKKYLTKSNKKSTSAAATTTTTYQPTQWTSQYKQRQTTYNSTKKMLIVEEIE